MYSEFKARLGHMSLRTTNKQITQTQIQMMGKKKGKLIMTRKGRREKEKGKYNENGEGNGKTGKGPGCRDSKSSCGSIMIERGHKRQF